MDTVGWCRAKALALVSDLPPRMTRETRTALAGQIEQALLDAMVRARRLAALSRKAGRKRVGLLGARR